MTNSNSNVKQTINNTLNIKDVVKTHTNDNFKNGMIRCTFHDDKTPSFKIYPETESWYCFGCEKGGDIITFIELIESTNFRGALKILKEDFGVQIDLNNKQLKKEKKKRNELEKITKMYDLAVDYFVNNLTQEVIEFIQKNYGLTEETIKKARIGYCKDGILDFLQKQGFSKKDIHRAGLVTKKDNVIKDMFYNRIMIPYIKNEKIKYFTGRDLANNDNIKYLNLKNNSKHVKNILFYARLNSSEKLLLTESELDALSATELTNKFDIIASGKAGLSKSKKKELFEIIDKYEEIIIINDLDENQTGLNAAIKTAKTILKEKNKIVKIAKLKQINNQTSVDISDYNKYNEEFMPVIAESKDFLELLISNISHQKNGRAAIKSAKKLYSILSFVDEDIRAYYIDLIRKEISKVSGCNKSTLKKSTIENSIKEIENKQNEKEKESKLWFEKSKNGYIKFKPALLAKHFLDNNNYITLSDNIYQYEDGVFEDIGIDNLNKEMQKNKFLGEEWESYRANEVIDYIKRATKSDAIKIFEEQKNENLINVKNGMLDFKEQKLIKHSPKFKSFNQINAKYDASITSHKKLEETISSILLDKKDTDKNKIKVFWEFVASIICSKNLAIKKSLMLLGNGNNGKSVLLNFLTNFLGRDNVSSLSLYDLSNNNFTAAGLFGKIANLAGEMSNSVIKDLELFKKLTGNDLISADQKFKERFSFKNRAKLIFALNTLPKIQSYEDAFFDRLLIVRTPNTFTKNSKDYDPKILDKITTDKAKSYALNQSIKALKRLIANDLQFTQSKKIKEELRNYKSTANKVITFVEERCNIKPGAITIKNKLYCIYKRWSNLNGYAQLSKKKFSTRITKEFNVKSKVKRVDGKSTRVWENLEINS